VDDPSFFLPGTLTWRPAPASPHPPLGWNLACHVTDIECFPLVATHAEALPLWVPVAIVAPPALIPAIEAGVRLFDTARHGQTAIIPHTASSPPRPEPILDAINARQVPTVPLLAGWLGARLGFHEQITLLRDGMAPAGAPSSRALIRRTLQRHIQAGLACHPSDLRRLVRLARQERLSPTVSQLADLAGTTEARLRRLVTTLVGREPLLLQSASGMGMGPRGRLPEGAGGWGLGADRR